ncbi:hypothetical protein [Psychrobacter sp. BI730]|uniref:hypothetical protein n=1 Tax=Psychrobacter sp. BI730 TaxID=2705463 RepID=UPI0015C69E70|nr:hypothetical protein [Psychrobacter sp. BI730]NYR09575.1 hypothetical protein [Psychrobacter sp. BI730]
MTFDQLLNYFDGQSYRDIEKQTGIALAQLTYYKNHGIPEGRQAILEIQTGGALKANVTPLVKLEDLEPA